jgi:hypothetical protein
LVCNIEGCNFFCDGKIPCIGFGKGLMDFLSLPRLYRDKVLQGLRNHPGAGSFHGLRNSIELSLQSARDTDR